MDDSRAHGDSWDPTYPLVIVEAVLGASVYLNFLAGGPIPVLRNHLGGEYRCIAQALAAGRGFSDPFGVPTGPTAWMPPVFPVLMAVLLKILGEIEAVAAVVLTLQNLVLIYMGLLVLRLASEPEHAPGSRALALALYVSAIACNYYYLFVFTHDHLIVMFWVCLFVDVADRLVGRAAGTLATVGWGVIGGLSVLTSPVLGPVWAGLTVMLAASANRFRQFAISFLIATAVIAPWIARNALVFHRFIPVKSNLAFELYQSQCLEPDGVLRDVTALAYPFLNEQERALYTDLGEMKYLEAKRGAFLDSVRQSPLSYCKRVANRFLAATILFRPYESSHGPVSKLLGKIIHPIPMIGMVLMLANPGWARDRRKLIALVIFIVYMIPYILVSFYIRYTVPLLLIKLLFVFWGIESLRRMRWPSG